MLRSEKWAGLGCVRDGMVTKEEQESGLEKNEW